MPTSQDSTIQLLFEPTLKVPDEVIDGVVQLHFPSLIEDKIEEVHVKLRGSVYTEISRPNGTSVTVDTRRVHLIKEGLSLWNAGTYPPAGSDTLEIPFAFRLPSNLPPSFEYGDIKKSLERVRLRYAVEVVGKRPGLLRSNRRTIKPFPVLPPLRSGAELREVLKRGWEGPWRSYSDKKSIRKGIWGDYSDVAMTLSLPEVDAFPVFAPIPFTITLTTHSKLTKRDDKSSEDTIFPTPPVDPHAVDFRLMRDVWLKAQSMDFTCTGKTVEHLGSLGAQKSPSPKPNTSVTVAPLAKVWIPETGEKGGEKGRWKQEVTFKSTMQFSCTPTFTSETVDLSYKLKLHVDYPGVKNSQTIEVPVKIVSSMYPIGEQAWDGPPLDLALPPDYFQGTWEDDPNEKE